LGGANNPNDLFRCMGKLLVSDVLFTTSGPVTTVFNESGLRTGNDASNPAQFKNLVSGWIDATPVFPAGSLTAPYSAQPTEFIGLSSSFPSTPTITDEGELAMRSLFTRRFNQIFSYFKKSAPCVEVGACADASIARCAREILLQEYRVIVREFLAEAKLLFSAQAQAVTFNRTTAVVPVELAAAQIFDLHWAPAATSCPTPSDPGVVTNSPATCINTLLNVKLPTQRDWAIAPTPVLAGINATAERIKAMGLGSINAYLHKLGLPLKSHPLSDHVLLDLHDSDAEYAFNFGVLEDIFNRDSKVSFANDTCFQFPPYSIQLGQTAVDQWKSVVNSFLSMPERNLCSLYLHMQDANRYETTMALAVSAVRPNMFRSSGALGTTC
jgi:hypothetical protein